MKLSDLQAPPWSVKVGGVAYRLRPLSLSVFSEAELCGLSLGRLSDATDTSAWVELFAFLSNQDPQDSELLANTTLPTLLLDPLGFEAFRVKVAASFSGEDAANNANNNANNNVAAPSKNKPRKTKKYKPPEEAVEEKKDIVDYGFLLDVSRASSIALRDLMAMTFYGVTCVSKSLERMPPMPGMAGLI